MLLEFDFGRSEPGLGLRKIAPHVGFLVVAKIARSGILFPVADLLGARNVPLFVVTFIELCVMSLVFLLIHKPWTGEKQFLLSKQKVRLGLNGALYGVSLLLWTVGLAYCGPLRTVAFEFAEVVVLYLLSRGLKARGVIILTVALLVLGVGVIGQDVAHTDTAAELAAVRGGAGRIAPNVTVGLLCLVLSAALNLVRKQGSRRAAQDFGGAKRLHSLSVLAATVLMAPGALLQAGVSGFGGLASLWSAALLLIAPLLAGVLTFYADHDIQNMLPRGPAAVAGLASSISAAFLLDIAHAGRVAASIPTVLGLVFCCVGAYIALSAEDDGGMLDADGGLPVTRAAAAGGVLRAQSILQHVLESPKSRKIFFYLLLNLMYMLVELVYGYWTNSLGLMSDASHMFFDCMALAIGLYASVMTQWRPNPIFSFGYARYEVLSGFVNAVFLVVIGLFVFLEAVHRIVRPPELNSHRLIIVSFLGLLVNLVGIFFFHDAHSHGHSHGHSHDHGHSHAHEHKDEHAEEGHAHHSHDEDSHDHHGHSHDQSGHSHDEHCDHDHGEHGHEHGHSHDEHGHSHDYHGHSHDEHEHAGHVHSDTCKHDHAHDHRAKPKKAKKAKKASAHHDHNMEGVFLHVLADTLGSVGVLTSSLLMYFFGWNIADAICSLIIAVLIVGSVIPLLTQSAKTLLQRAPLSREDDVGELSTALGGVKGVRRVQDLHVWALTQDSVVGTVRLLVDADADEAVLLRKANKLLRAAGLADTTVEVEREASAWSPGVAH